MTFPGLGKLERLSVKLLFQIKSEWWNNPAIAGHICSVLPLFSSQRNVPIALLLKCGMPTGRSTSPFQHNLRCVQTCPGIFPGVIPFLFTFSKICRIWLEDAAYATAEYVSRVSASSAAGSSGRSGGEYRSEPNPLILVQADVRRVSPLRI